MYKISVIVPVYNTFDYLVKCVDSICNQSYRDLEILLIDDGSTDGSSELCDRLSQGDERIKVIHKENGGQLSARIVGAENASGSYIVSVDSDDWIEIDRVSNIVEKGLGNEPDLVYIDGISEDRNGISNVKYSKRFRSRYYDNEIKTSFISAIIGDQDVFFDRAMLSHVTVCVKREIYKKNIELMDTRIRRIEDVISVFSFILDCREICCISDAGYHYVYRKGSISRHLVDWRKDHSVIYYAQMKRILDRHIHEMTPDIIRMAILFSYHNIFLTNYKKLYEYYNDTLFPFENIKNGNSVVIYGAGNIGVEMVNAIDDNPRVKLVAWIDKNTKDNPRSRHVVNGIDYLEGLKYDYIAIAILSADASRSAKQELVDIGISETKIVLMNSLRMSLIDLDDILC